MPKPSHKGKPKKPVIKPIIKPEKKEILTGPQLFNTFHKSTGKNVPIKVTNKFSGPKTPAESEKKYSDKFLKRKKMRKKADEQRRLEFFRKQAGIYDIPELSNIPEIFRHEVRKAITTVKNAYTHLKNIGPIEKYTFLELTVPRAIVEFFKHLNPEDKITLIRSLKEEANKTRSEESAKEKEENVLRSLAKTYPIHISDMEKKIIFTHLEYDSQKVLFYSHLESKKLRAQLFENLVSDLQAVYEDSANSYIYGVLEEFAKSEILTDEEKRDTFFHLEGGPIKKSSNENTEYLKIYYFILLPENVRREIIQTKEGRTWANEVNLREIYDEARKYNLPIEDLLSSIKKKLVKR